MKTLLILAFFFCLPLVAYSAVYQGTIITKDGTRYENIEYYPYEEYNVVQVFRSDGTKNISYHKIAVIYNEDGNDITRKIIGRPSTQPEKSQAVEEETSDSSTGLEKTLITKGLDYDVRDQVNWGTCLQLNYCYQFLQGDYTLISTSESVFEGGLMIGISQNLSLKLSYLKKTYHANDEFITIYPDDSLLYNKIDVSIQRYLLSLYYHRPLIKSNPLGHFYYISSGLGITDHSISGFFSIEYPWNTIDKYRASTEVTKLTTNIECGLGFVQSDHICIMLGVGWCQIPKGDDENNVDRYERYYNSFNIRSAGVIELKAGLILFIG